MPLVTFSCPHCNTNLTANVVPKQMAKCATCGKTFTISSIPGYAEITPVKQKASLWTGLAIAVLAIIAIGKCSGTSTRIDGFRAQVDCERFVLNSLKSPSSASFAPYQELIITGSGDGPWTVKGWVDAQNSFGAKLRSQYSCAVQYSGDSAQPVYVSVN